ncbi:Amino acid/polyamine transporter I [Corchorus capsularis]|uniref:Amino acid/polyamine transporter I n=1 Tax=Corchorus capsularis TaxID=210143 RepID=A0A1R3KYY1_COCAP|nr:Amino acid/polyamine transporter I [Corchorus capsularis]
MAMARDGLVPSFFSDISTRTQVPVKSTVAAGILAAILALFMDVSELSGMVRSFIPMNYKLVSVGTLLAFTVVAISILILRYAPPDEVPLPASLQESLSSLRMQLDDDSQRTEGKSINSVVDIVGQSSHQLEDGEASIQYPLIEKQITEDKRNQRRRRKIAGWNIALFCIGVIVFTSAASAEYLPSLLRFALGAVGAAILLCSLIVLACLNQDEGRHSFGHTGGTSKLCTEHGLDFAYSHGLRSRIFLEVRVAFNVQSAIFSDAFVVNLTASVDIITRLFPRATCFA